MVDICDQPRSLARPRGVVRNRMPIVVLVSALSASVGCSKSPDPLYDRLRDAPPGTVIAVSDLFPTDVSEICLRSPYEPISMSRSDDRASSLGEDSWAFVFRKAGAVEHRIYERSSELDVVQADQLGGASPASPHMLKLAPCVSRQRGVVVSFRRLGRKTFTLAERVY